MKARNCCGKERRLENEALDERTRVCLQYREKTRSQAQFGQTLPTIRRALPCSSMSGTKFSIGLGGRGAKALCGRATSCGQSSTEGTPTTLWGDNGHNQQQARRRRTRVAVSLLVSWSIKGIVLPFSAHHYVHGGCGDVFYAKTLEAFGGHVLQCKTDKSHDMLRLLTWWQPCV